MPDQHIDQRLSEYLDGELTPPERTGIDAHLALCASCRAVLDDLRLIVAAAAHLPESRPDRELWAGIDRRIGASARVAAFEPRPRRRVSFTLPQLAAASIALMLLSGGIAYVVRPAQTPPAAVAAADPGSDRADGVALVTLADPQFDGAVADLERTLARGRQQLDPETVRVLEQNLATIDTAIDQCRRALEADPANAFLNTHLVSARQRKLALLRRATALTTGS